jgi:hypothetical protein
VNGPAPISYLNTKFKNKILDFLPKDDPQLLLNREGALEREEMKDTQIREKVKKKRRKKPSKHKK